MKDDPYTLRVALNLTLGATGELYLDDGDSFAFENGELVWRSLTCSCEGSSFPITITNTRHLESQADVHPARNDDYSARIEKIIVLGLVNAPKTVLVGDNVVRWSYTSKRDLTEHISNTVIIKNPGLYDDDDWVITLH